MTRERALDEIQAAIATFSPVPITQEALSQMEQALESLEAHAERDTYRRGYRHGSIDRLRSLTK